jgi:SAM-dependent methyltransferase
MPQLIWSTPRHSLLLCGSVGGPGSTVVFVESAFAGNGLMKIYEEPLSDVTRYLQNNGNKTVEDMREEYNGYLKLIRQFVNVSPDTKILEIGTGTGWFPLIAKMEGLNVRGLEISRQLVQNARQWGQSIGVDPDIQLGNAEEADIGDSEFDVIVANSVFEHIERWEVALGRVYKALKPGGILFFASTNKWCPISYEYEMYFYSYMPDRMRYKFRQLIAGPEIMKLGIDFNQFTYPQLRRAFQQAGFREVMDRLDVVNADRFSGLKGFLIGVAKANRPLRWTILNFCDSTLFVCRK